MLVERGEDPSQRGHSRETSLRWEDVGQAVGIAEEGEGSRTKVQVHPPGAASQKR